MSQTLKNKMRSNLFAAYRRGKGMPKSQDPDRKHIHARRTLDGYLRETNRYAAWLKAQGHKSRMPISEAVQQTQPYLDYLIDKGYAPATVHTTAAAVCKALGVKMRDYHVPLRNTPPKKGRKEPDNIAEIENDPRYQRIISFARVVGIRREEYENLKGRDLIYREGHCYVHVAQGKGGKRQDQLIDDIDVPVVEACFAGIGPDDPVFAPWELSHQLNLHRYRREHAQEMYARYMARMEEDPGYRQELIQALKCTFERGGRDWRKNRDMSLLDHPYYVQKGVREDMIAHHRPVCYDRVALLAVSVWHLSHWRCGVTVGNYMR